MPDWRVLVRERLDLSKIEDRRQRRIIEELAGQLDDVHSEALAEGLRDEEAEARALQLIPDWKKLSSALANGTRVHRRRASERFLEESEERLRRGGGGRRLLANLARDLRHTLRSIRLAPAFWAVTVAILALGIGATTTIFSVADSVLLKRLPYPEEERLVALQDPAFPVQLFEDWKEFTNSYDLMAGHWEEAADYVAGEKPERLRTGLVTPGYFALFGARPSIGRLFLPEDFDGAPHRMVLSHGAWQRLFGGDEGVVGRTVTIDDRAVLIVGILDAGFTSPGGLAGAENDVWLALDPHWEEIRNPDIYILEVYGRLRDGVSTTAAQLELDRLTRTLAEERPELHLNRRGEPREVRVTPLQAAVVGSTATTVRLLMGAVLLLLLIACADVAHVFLARGTERVNELAVRSALGAGGGRLAMQLLTESSLVALAGGLFGVILAFSGVHAFKVLNPGDIPLMERVAVDGRALTFAVVLSLLTGVVFGLFPAWRAARWDGAAALRDNRRSGEARDRSRLRSTLVASEIALSLVLLTGAGLLFHSFIRLRAVAPGFVTEGLAAVTLSVERHRYSEAERRDLVGRLLRRVEGLPSVDTAAVAWTVPFQHFGSRRVGWLRREFRVDGEDLQLQTMIQPVTESYFTTLGADLRGSMWSAANRDYGPVPAVVSESFADALFPSSEAIGRTFQGLQRGDDGSQTALIIGVVSGLHHWGLNQGCEPTVYVPWERLGAWAPLATLLVRTSGDPARILTDLQRAVWSEDPLMPLPAAFTVTGRLMESLTAPRFYTALLATFAVVAVLLAAGGVYGAMLCSVGGRRHELGVRAALGARRDALLRLIMRRSGIPTALGLMLGTAGALLVSRALEHALFGITPIDVTTYAAAVVLLALVATVAALVPAWQAAQTDPMEVLRTE